LILIALLSSHFREGDLHSMCKRRFGDRVSRIRASSFRSKSKRLGLRRDRKGIDKISKEVLLKIRVVVVVFAVVHDAIFSVFFAAEEVLPFRDLMSNESLESLLFLSSFDWLFLSCITCLLS
jgi:hypothetical protein